MTNIQSWHEVLKARNPVGRAGKKVPLETSEEDEAKMGKWLKSGSSGAKKMAARRLESVYGHCSDGMAYGERWVGDERGSKFEVNNK